MDAFTWVDWAVIGVLALSALIGLGIGIVKMALMVSAWIGAALITLYGHAPLTVHVQKLLMTVDVIASGVTALGLFVVSLIVLLIITQIVSGLVEGSALGMVNRSLGLIFGTILGFAMLAVAFLLYTDFATGGYHADVRSARTLPLLEFGRDAALALLPGVSGLAGGGGAPVPTVVPPPSPQLR